MMNRLTPAYGGNGVKSLLLFPRILLLMVMVPHGLGKFNASKSFSERFDMPVAVVLAGGMLELLAGLAVAAGAVLYGMRDTVVTWLGALVILVIQIMAIVIAHPSAFFYFAPGGGGMEYNLVVIGLCLMLLIGTVQYRREGSE